MNGLKKLKLGIALFSVALLAGIGWQLWRSDDSAPQKEVSVERKSRSLIPEVKPAQPKVVLAKENAESNNQLQITEAVVKSNEKSTAVVAKAADLPEIKDAPRCPKYPDTPVHAYRTAKLAPKAKGGAEGELREWLVKPNPEGYEHHVEEEYYPNENGEMVLAGTKEYVANQVIVTLDAECDRELFSRELASFGMQMGDVLMKLQKGGCLVPVKTPDISLDAAAEIIEAVGKTKAHPQADYDLVVRLAAVTPNDTSYSQQWALPKISAPSAWSVRTDASTKIVAVIDTGVRYTHVDLAGNMWQNPQTGRFTGVTGDAHGMSIYAGVKTGDPNDLNGHGSHCAGIIAACGNNGKGVCGVAWKAKIMAVRVFNANGGLAYTTDQLVGMEYARDMGASILSCSWGVLGASSSVWQTAVTEMQSAGIICVFAAGNDATNTDSTQNIPSCFANNNIVSVAATTSSDGLASFSNYGTSTVDIAAPGVSILSTCNGSNTDYQSYQGTSMATPCVAGAIALIWSQFPNETYLQIIQRLYNGADTVSALSGKVAGARRLNVLKPLTGIVAPQISASKGTYSDKVRVTWNSVSGASYYRVYRSTSSTGTKTALGSGWQTSTAFNDTTAALNVTYYYWAKSATSSSGANASDYSAYSTGWRTQTVYPDAWDPNDNTAAGTTNVLSMSTTVKTQTHGLNANDWYDFAKVYLTSGNTYVFETTGEYDMYGELFNSTSTNSSYRVAYNDDGGTNYNYKITYTPTSSGYYYLRTRRYAVGNIASYVLRYKQQVSADRWDPGDDTASGGTTLTPTTSVQTHGQHTLTDTDLYDWFKISMTAGRTYTFESTYSGSCYDMYGELYDSTLATTAHRVAYNDDGGSQALQFKISYTPTTSGTYYLRVRRWSVGAVGVYSLKYSVSVPNSHDLVFCRSTSWSDFVFVSNVTNAMSGLDELMSNDTVYMTYGFTDICDNDISGSFTNTIQLLKYDSAQATTYTVLRTVRGSFPSMEAGTWWSSRMNFGNQSAGYYGVRVELNLPRTITETNYVNNVRIARFAVKASGQDEKTLTGLSVSGDDSIVGGNTKNYTATATFSDGSTANVTASASWSCSSPAVKGWANGVVQTEAVTATTTATLEATYVYNGVSKKGTKSISITATPTPGEERICPIGPAVVYPISPMTVYAEVKLDDEDAQAGDVLCAYVGNECRGYLELRTGGKGPINIYVTSPSEKITFKSWSSRFPEGEDLFTCSTELAGEIGGELGSPTEPYKIDCYGNDPFGTPAQYPNPPMTIVAKVVIKGEPAASGDMVGVFCGDQLRAKGAVRVEGGIAKITLSPSVNVAGETLTFKVWDKSASELLNANGSVSAVVGGDVGSPESRYVIEVSDKVTQSISLNSSTWQFVSFNVTPTNPAPKVVFADLASDIDRVTCGDKVFKPTWGDSDNTLGDIAVGSGYWIKRKTTGTKTLSVAGMPGDVASTTIRLAAGWNSVGYVPQQAGAIRSVLANALSLGVIDRVTSGDQVFKPSWSDGDNTLTTMTPGKGYWIKATAAAQFTYVEPSGSGAAAALAALASENEAEHPFGDDRDTDVTSGVLLRAKLNLWGTDAVYGDAWVAAYANGSAIPCSVAQVNLSGNLIMNIVKVPAFDLTFKVYDAISKRLYDSPTVISFARGEDEKEGQTVSVSGTAPTYKVVFDLVGAGGGSGYRTGGGALTQNVSRAASAVAPTVTGNLGYEFYLWDTDFSNIKCDTTVRAIYQAVEIKTTLITFNANGGSGGPGSVTATKTLPMPTISVKPTLAGYTFAGYFDAASDGVQYYTADLASARNWDKEDASKTLYAHWTALPTYTITYKPGAYGTGTQRSVTKVQDVALTLPSAIFTRVGYVQTGWSWYDGSGRAFECGGSFTRNANSDLYPFWTPNQYTVALDANGGTGGQSFVTATYGSAMPSIASKPTKSGYSFTGYYDADGAQYYSANLQSVRNWDKANSSTMLYAHWAVVQDFGYKVVGGCAVLTNYTGASGVVTIPAEIDGYPVTTVGQIFKGRLQSVTEVIIPEGVTTLGQYAFHQCRALRSITLPSTLTTIEQFALAECSSLLAVHIPAGVTTIGDGYYNGFGGNASQISFTVAPENTNFEAVDGVLFVKGLGELVSYPAGRDGEDYDIPESVSNVWSCAFDSCQNLVSVTVPEGVSALYYCAFEGCSSLEEITLPESLIDIDFYTFMNCGALKELVVPKNVDSIGYNALAGTELERLVLLGRSAGTDSYERGYARERWGADISNGNIWVRDADYSYWTTYLGTGLRTIIPYVNAEVAEWCEEMGTVTGGGKNVKTGDKVTLKATAKKGYVFAGWYLDAACCKPVEGDIDYRSPSLSVVAGDAESTYYAWFVEQEEDFADIFVCFAEDEYALGNSIEPITLDIGSFSLPTVTVKGLPTGLKFTAKAVYERGELAHEANTIYGTPTKSGIYTVTISVKTASKITATETLKIIVRDEDEALIDAEYDSDCGKVTGTGICAEGKTLTLKATANKGYVFAGWFYDDEFEVPVDDKGVDYRSTSLPVSGDGCDMTYYAWFVESEFDTDIEAYVEDEYEIDGEWELPLEIFSFSLPSVTASGLPTGLKLNAKTLTIEGTPTKPGVYTVTLSLKNTTVKKALTQTFVIKVANIVSLYLDVDYATDAYVYHGGVAVGWNIGDCATEGYSVSGVTGLPTGLKFNTKTGMIEGVPTKTGTYTVTVSLKNGSQKSTATVTLNVEAIDTWAYGTFNGGSNNGQAQLTITSAGKISGKYCTGGLTYTLSAASFESWDDGLYMAKVTASYNVKNGTKTVKTTEQWTVQIHEGSVGGELYCISADEDWKFDAYQNLWSQKDWKTLGTSLFGKRGTTLTFTGDEYGLGEDEKLSLLIRSNGSVTIKGKFTVSRAGVSSSYSATASSVVCVKNADPFDGFVYVYFPANENRGFDGYTFILPVSVE